jgi:hypothetical protein
MADALLRTGETAIISNSTSQASPEMASSVQFESSSFTSARPATAGGGKACSTVSAHSASNESPAFSAAKRARPASAAVKRPGTARPATRDAALKVFVFGRQEFDVPLCPPFHPFSLSPLAKNPPSPINNHAYTTFYQYISTFDDTSLPMVGGAAPDGSTSPAKAPKYGHSKKPALRLLRPESAAPAINTAKADSSDNIIRLKHTNKSLRAASAPSSKSRTAVPAAITAAGAAPAAEHCPSGEGNAKVQNSQSFQRTASKLPPPAPGTAHRRYTSVYPCANLLLAKRWDDAARERHRIKIATMKTYIDNSPPKIHGHLQLRMKKMRQEEGIS